MLLGFNFLRRHAKMWDLERGKIQVCGMRGVQQIDRAGEEYQPVRVEPPVRPDPEKQPGKATTWTKGSKKKRPEEELRKKREKDRRPFTMDLEGVKPTPPPKPKVARKAKASKSKAMRRVVDDSAPSKIAGVAEWERAADQKDPGKAKCVRASDSGASAEFCAAGMFNCSS